MARPRRVAIQQIAALLIAGLLLTLSLASSNASAAQPIARTASKPVATVTRSMLHIAMVDRAAAKRSLSHDIKRLKACKRARPRHCRHLRRTVRHARGRLAYASRRVNRLRAHLALAHRPAKQASPQSAPASTDFGQPFVKGVDTNIQGWGAAALPTIASEMSSLGVNWAREDLSWSDVESQKGVFDWSSFDKIVYDAQARGITILPIVGYAPSWSSPGDSADYAAFVKAAVERYCPGTRANLPWWELWNEPYFAYAWGNKTAEPAAYARDAVAAAEAAKGAAPSVKLLLAADYEDEKQVGSSQWETAWIDDMFTAEPSLGHWIDGVSIHPYGEDPAVALSQPGGFRGTSGGWSFQRIDTVRSKFLSHGVNVPFWITEAGKSTAEVSESTQATYYSDLIPQIAARPWVRALFPYCLREFDAAGGKESEFGLLKYGSWSPKPAFFALQKALSGLA
jgi:polysaccharide biosynthesis protein PslG